MIAHPARLRMSSALVAMLSTCSLYHLDLRIAIRAPVMVGMLIEIDATKALHVDLAYASTVTANAALPAERMFAHLPAGNADLANLRPCRTWSARPPRS